MARKIRFPLQMKNGVQVRTLEELKDNFDLESVLGYFENGKLATWLKDRYYDDMAEQIESLDIKSLDFNRQLCDILGIEYEYTGDEVNLENSRIRNERLARLRQYTDDKDIIQAIDSVAFDQDELFDRLDEGHAVIYLCGDKFSIPSGKKNIQYIGLNNPLVLLEKGDIQVYHDNIITFRDVQFEETVQSKMDEENRKSSTKVLLDTLVKSGVVIKETIGDVTYIDINSLPAELIGKSIVKKGKNEVSNLSFVNDTFYSRVKPFIGTDESCVSFGCTNVDLNGTVQYNDIVIKHVKNTTDFQDLIQQILAGSLFSPIQMVLLKYFVGVSMKYVTTVHFPGLIDDGACFDKTCYQDSFSDQDLYECILFGIEDNLGGFEDGTWQPKIHDFSADRDMIKGYIEKILIPNKTMQGWTEYAEFESTMNRIREEAIAADEKS